MSRRYVYAILAGDAVLPPGVLGIDDAPLTAVSSGPLAAAVSLLDGAELRRTPERLLRHAAVAEALRQGARTLPVRFGTVLAGSDAVVQALNAQAAVLLADLERLGDKLEMGLSVLWDAPEAEQETVPSHHEGRLGTPVGPGTQYLAARLLNQRREEAALVRARAAAQKIEAALRPVTLAGRGTVLPTPRLLLRGAYLLTPDREDAFREAVEGMRQAQQSLRFLINGPWQPYSFVTQPEAPLTAMAGGWSQLAAAITGNAFSSKEGY